MIYFAYGSNMNTAEMAVRCPGARALGVAVLEGHAMFVTADGYVAIRRRRGHAVHGVAWWLSMRDIVVLDRYESAGTSSYRRVRLPLGLAGRTVRASVYCSTARVGNGRPRRDYFIHSVLGSSLSWGLPDYYVAKIGRLARLGFRA